MYVNLTNREINHKNQTQETSVKTKKIISDAVLIFIIASFITFLAPFGMNKIHWITNWSFWLVMCFSGYIICAPIIYWGQFLLSKYAQKYFPYDWMKIAIAAFFACIVMSFFIPIVNIYFFSLEEHYLELVPRVLPHSFIIGGFITFASVIKAHIKAQKKQLVQQQDALSSQQQQVTNIKNEKLLDFMNKLPIEKRGKLICFEMDDHYLNVHTDKGNHLLLMRFKDALTFVEEHPGMQTHRSWWVALDAIEKEQKEGRKILLKLTNGLSAPVSKTYLAKVKEMI